MRRQRGVRDKKQEEMREKHLNEILKIINQKGHVTTAQILPYMKITRQAVINCLNELIDKGLISKINYEYCTKEHWSRIQKEERDIRLRESVKPLRISPIDIDSKWRRENIQNSLEAAQFYSTKQGNYPAPLLKLWESSLWFYSMDDTEIRSPGLTEDDLADGEIYEAVENLIKTVIRKRKITTYEDASMIIDIHFNILDGYSKFIDSFDYKYKPKWSIESLSNEVTQAASNLITNIKRSEKQSFKKIFERKFLKIVNYPSEVIEKIFPISTKPPLQEGVLNKDEKEKLLKVVEKVLESPELIQQSKPENIESLKNRLKDEKYIENLNQRG